MTKTIHLINRMMNKKRNQRHYFSHHDVIITELTRNDASRDCYYINNLIKEVFNYLNEHDIKNYQNFIDLFRNIGLKLPAIVNLMNGLKNYITDLQTQQKKAPSLGWLKYRELKKVNYEGKNMIFNRFASEYPIEFIKFTKFYLSQNYPDLINLDFLIKELKKKIDEVRSQDIKNIALNTEDIESLGINFNMDKEEENTNLEYLYFEEDLFSF